MSAALRVLRGRRVVVEGAVRPAAIHVSGGRIVAIRDPDDLGGSSDVTDAGDALVTPGCVDAHVHVNEPGRTEWEGYATATAAAAAGGVTTLVDMPLNGIPPATTAAGVEARRAALAGTARVDVALWGGLVPGNVGELPALAAAGVAGIKCFLSPSGVDEFPHVGEAELDAALPVLRRLRLPLLAHAEDPAALLPPRPGADPRAHATWAATRPPEAEARAIEMLARACRRHGAAVHVVHVSSAAGVEAVRRARAEGLPVTAETCPHYLVLDADAVPDGATEFKCAPPLRTAADRDALWAALADGTLDDVATDHSPAPPALKARASGDFLAAWGGIASLQLFLPALWTGASARGHGPGALVRWAAGSPARRCGLAGRKGALAPGHDADIVIWDDAAAFVVDPAALHHRHPLTPWAGRTLRGVVRETWLRGHAVYTAARGSAAGATGRFIAARAATD